MKSKMVDIYPGDILLYKRYNLLKELWYQIRKKELPFNKFSIWGSPAVIYYSGNENVTVLTPKRRYNNKEIAKLNKWLQDNFVTYKNLELVIKAANAVRSGTFAENATIEDVINSSYYKRR